MSIIANSTSGAIRSISEREYTRIIEAIQQPSDLPLADADQVISGRFSGRVVVTDKGSSAFSVDDHVTVEVRYDTAPDEVHQFPDYSATGYYFSGDPNRGEMVVRIGNEVWSSGSRLEIFVQNDRSDGGPDMVKFGGFHSVDASSAQRARIQFFLADNSISSLLSDERMPTSLSDLDFSGAESPDCCFWGLIESDSAPHYSTILVKIDRSTFELSIDDGR